MCGLTGIYNHKGLCQPEEELFRNLLVLNFNRGVDSTGVIRVPKEGKSDWDKTLDPSPFYAFSDIGDSFIRSTVFMRALLGHTRSATKGVINRENAHPFEFSRVVGMHNGTINGFHPGKEIFNTDSEALYNEINLVGVEHALSKFMKADDSGAYALQFIDKKYNSVHFVKNNKRTLWFTFLRGQETLVWSSSKETLLNGISNYSNEFQSKMPLEGNSSKLKNILDHITIDKVTDCFTLKSNVLITLLEDKISAKKLKSVPESKSFSSYSYYKMGNYVGNDTTTTPLEQKVDNYTNRKSKNYPYLDYKKRYMSNIFFLPWLKDNGEVGSQTEKKLH